MKQKTTFSLWKRLLLLLVLCVPLVQSLGQTKVYADYLKHNSYGTKIGGVITNIDALKNNDDNDYATINTYGGLALGLGRYGGSVEFQFTKDIPANQWSYIRIGGDQGLLQGLLGGSLGKLLGGVVGGLALGNQNISVEVFDSKTNKVVLQRSSLNGFDTDRVKLIETGEGHIVLAVKPVTTYKKIRISNVCNTLLLAVENFKLDVYGVYTISEDSASCGKPIGTSYSGAGLSLSVLEAQNQNLGYAIDDNKSTSSFLSPGSLLSLNVGGSIAQQFYFPTTTGAKGSVNVRLSLGSEGVLNLNLLGGVEILAYNGNSTAPVFQKTLSGGLISDLNLLNLLKLGKDATITVAPQKDFDRIEVRMNLPVNVNLLGASVRIYDVQHYDGVTCMNPALVIPESTVEPFEVASCSTKLGAFDNAEFPLNAVDGNNESFTTLSASNGSLLVKAPYNGRIEMKYDSPLKANKTSYIRIDTDKELLDALLGGSLGKLVADLGGILLGKHIINVEAFNDKGNSITKISSSNGFDGSANGFVRLVQDNIGRYYLAVTPNEAYQSIVVSNSVGSLLPTGEVRELKVYNMCTEIGTDICFPAQFASYDISGLNLGLADLSKAGVKNPYHAISPNSSNYSEVNVGLLGVGTKVSQRVYFNHPSEINSTLTVKAFLNPANVLDLDILGRYSVVTSLNGVEQDRFTLKQGILNNIDVLGLFKRGSAYTFNFKTTKKYDRVDIVIESLVKVGTSPALRVYNVNRYSDNCPLPTTENPFTQSACAVTVVSEDHTDNSANVVDGNFDSYATIHSDPGVILGGGSYIGHLEMAYDHTVAAGKTSYVRFDFDDTVLDGLLGGSLGNIVTGLLDHLLLGAHYFDIDVKDENGLTVLQGSSKGELASFIKKGSIRIVRDKVGRTYIAITPTVPYKSVRITDKTSAVTGILAAPGSMNVYGMCYEESTDPCLSAFATSYELTGLSLDVKDLSGAGVKYPERAIDSNTTNYSEISTGTLNIAGSVRQYIYFNTPSKIDDVVMIKFKTQGGQVNASLLGSIEIKAFLGDKEVATLPINKGLVNGVNVADLLTNNKIVELPFTPGVSYDRISVGMKSLVGVTVGANLHLYDVERTCKSLPQSKKLVSWKSYKVNGDATIKAVAGKEIVEYTIYVRNEGTEDISSFTITDKLPQGLTFVSTNDGAFTEGNVVFSSKKNLASGEVTTFVFTAQVEDNLDGIDVIKNIAYTQFDPAIPATASFPPKDNVNPKNPDTTKEPGTVILVNQCLVPTPKPIVIGDITDGLICQGSFITLSSNIDADDYQWFLDGNKLDKQVSESKTDNGKTFVTDKGGVYTLMIKKGKCWSEESDIFIVNQKPLPVIKIAGEREFMVRIGELVKYPAVSSTDGIVQWFDPKGNDIAELPKSFDTPGIYPFTAIVEKDGCTTTETIIVTVYDNTACPPSTKRVYAQGTGDWKTTWYTTLLGGVSNKENAVDANPTTHSTITLGLVVAGLGTTWQNMYFGGNEIPAGTPVSVKLGNEYSLLGVGDGITVVGLDKNGKDIGVVKAVGGGLLKLLTADNVYEYTFVPSDKTGPKAYYGVKVIYSALLGAGANMKIYGAYYNELGDSCSTNDYVPSDKVNIPSGVHPQILDIHHGIQDIGLGVATSLSPFVNPWRAVDNDPDSYAYINRSVAVINAATLTVLFKQQSMPGDELHIDIEDSSNPLLSLDLLKGFSIQRYLGDKKVGDQLDAKNEVIGLKLLGLGKGARRRIIVTPHDKPFDRVKIFYGNIVSVLGSETKIYDVSLNPQILKESIDLDKYYDVCFGGIFTIENNDGCTEFRVYTDIAKTGEITSKNGKDFMLSKKLPLGQHSIYVQGYRNGCEVGHLQEIKINHQNCSVKSNLNITHKIK
ncbi:DUF11 domain-containing protein [Myroides odoratimimus]|uniref:DUF11 domain-containing protein n=1 Tax=Myroides odoratimimus TaxID=76832 RepID=UPI001CE0332A|nr:DUF11 domain-containing protein [Myroides odoratimimus]MCA4805500.1 isopeptide-forming domain-containing fimbrial protein [Myroides odoratimimus]